MQRTAADLNPQVRAARGTGVGDTSNHGRARYGLRHLAFARVGARFAGMGSPRDQRSQQQAPLRYRRYRAQLRRAPRTRRRQVREDRCPGALGGIRTPSQRRLGPARAGPRRDQARRDRRHERRPLRAVLEREQSRDRDLLRRARDRAPVRRSRPALEAPGLAVDVQGREDVRDGREPQLSRRFEARLRALRGLDGCGIRPGRVR